MLCSNGIDFEPISFAPAKASFSRVARRSFTSSGWVATSVALFAALACASAASAQTAPEPDRDPAVEPEPQPTRNIAPSPLTEDASERRRRPDEIESTDAPRNWRRPASSPLAEQGFRIEPGLSVIYDDNVYRTDKDRADPVSDLIISPQVEARYTRDIGPRAVRLRALAGYDRFVSESQRSKPRFELEASGRLTLAGTCSVRPLASYRQQRADYGDINSAAENLQKFSTLGVSADCQRAAGLYPLAAYRRDTTRNGDGFEYADQTANLYRAGIGYARPSLGNLTLYYEHVDSDRPSLDLKNRSDAYGISFDRSVSPLTSLSADFRWMHVTSTSAAVGSYDGPAWLLKLGTTLIPRVKLTASTERAIVNDSLAATGFAIRTAHRIEADVAISELTSIGAYGELVRRDLRQDETVRVSAYSRDRTNQFGLIARRKITDRFDLDASVSRFHRDTNSDVSNYNATRVALGATARF